MRSWRWAFLAVALACGAACGRDEDRDAGGRAIVRFLEGPDTGGAWKEIIARFEKAHPDVKVELVEGPAATNTREDLYSTAFLAGDATYDLLYMDVIWVPKFAAAGWLAPLDDRFPERERAEFLAGDVAGGTYQGRIYRVPMRSDAGMLYYRKDLVPRPPRTLEELAKMAREAAKPPERWGFVFQGRQYEGLVCNFLEVLWGFGGDVLDERGNVVVDRPEAVRALEWMKGLVGTASPEGVATYQEEEARHVFQEGRAAFMRNWPYAWSKCQEPGSPVRGKVGIVAMPGAGRPGAATLGGWGFGIARKAKHPEAAWKFVRFATAAEQQKLFHLQAGAIPTRKSLFSDREILAASPHYPDLFRVLSTARPRPVHPRYPRISDALQVHLSAALVGKETPQQALARAAEEIRREIAR